MRAQLALVLLCCLGTLPLSTVATNSSACVAPFVNAAGACECPATFVQANNTCVCPATQANVTGVCQCNSTSVFVNGTCNTCPETYVAINGSCVCPQGASPRASDNKCTYCPSDESKLEPGACGCNLPDTDTDQDGTADCVDLCPIDAGKSAPGHCGCGVPDTDTDGDGALDNCDITSPEFQPIDRCPLDGNKTAGGFCGCQVPDKDTDNDGIPDCIDCPEGFIVVGNTCELPLVQCANGTVVRPDGELGCEFCPDDPAKLEPGQCGCGVPDVDSDGDGVADCVDACPSDGTKSTLGHCGCGIPDTDADGDGAMDLCDRLDGRAPRDTCLDDANKHSPMQCGCNVPDTDSDGDGTANCVDDCPAHAIKTAPGVCGCAAPDVDTDKDGALDCQEACPEDAAKLEAGACGCGVADTDSDGDGEADCNDGCVNDPGKTAPGQCGCGFVETDSDGDGVADCNDGCPADANKSAAGQCGCGAADVDGDGDGTADCLDGCPANALKTQAGVCGCDEVDTDTDGDGIPNCHDACPTSAAKTAPGVCGCDVLDLDGDGDGTPNCNDACRNDPFKTTAGACGCGVPEADTDGDGTPNCIDGCPTDATKTDAGTCSACGVCGCGNDDTDTDSDGTPDCIDACPDDPNKIGPGQCGCGVLDNDADGDGAATCNDGCFNDALKLAPGACGCGTPDTDSDGDGTADCNDACPSDRAKTEAGSCGCGALETDSDGDGTPDCVDGCPSDAAKQAPGTCGCGQSEAGATGGDRDGDGVPDCAERLAWVAGAWSSCTVPQGAPLQCGVGRRTRQVACRNATGTVKSHAHCEAVLGSSPPLQVDGCKLRSCIYRYAAGAWGACSASCGNGFKTRSISCVEVSGGPEVPVAYELCASAVPVPTKSQCLVAPCNGIAQYRTGDWGACSATCGGGTQSRAVTCIGAGGTVSASCTGTAPASVRACNDHPCESYAWKYTAYGECQPSCSSGSDRKRTRHALCVSSNGAVVPGWRCLLASPPTALTQACDPVVCPTFKWATSGWGECSKRCDFGTAMRNVTCVNAGTGDTVPEASCLSGGVAGAKPATSKPCNSFKCQVYSWVVSAWSPCSKTCDGLQSRSVKCSSGSSAFGVTPSATLCDGTTRPSGTARCSGAAAGQPGACDFCEDNTCSGRGSCSSGQCVCDAGFTGTYCETSAGCSGRLDTNGTCCRGVLMPDSRCCEGASATIDAQGACCASGVLDACGVCDGPATAVDVQGKCCAGQLDAAGFCCDTAEVDACGVCGGTNACSQEVALKISARLPDELTSLTMAQLNAQLADGTSSARASVDFTTQQFVAAALSMPAASVHVTAAKQVPGRRLEASRQLSTASTPLQVQVRLASDGDPTGSVVQEPDVLATQFAAHAAANTDTPVTVTSVVSSTALGVCGNGVCEVGERCDARNPFAACCGADCPFDIVSCPIANGQVCNGKGRCVASATDATLGQCQCFANIGIMGESCTECAPGYIASGSGSSITCLRIAAASCYDSVSNGGEEGVDCGGPCGACPAPPDDTTPTDDDEAQQELIMLILWAAIAVLFCVLVAMLAVWCNNQKHDREDAKIAEMLRRDYPDTTKPQRTRPAPATGKVAPVGLTPNHFLPAEDLSSADAKAAVVPQPGRRRSVRSSSGSRRSSLSGDRTDLASYYTEEDMRSRPSSGLRDPHSGVDARRRWSSAGESVDNVSYHSGDLLLSRNDDPAAYQARHDAVPAAGRTASDSVRRSRDLNTSTHSARDGGSTYGSARAGGGAGAGDVAAARPQDDVYVDDMEYEEDADDLLAQLVADADSGDEYGQDEIQPAEPTRRALQPPLARVASRKINTTVPLNHTPRGSGRGGWE